MSENIKITLTENPKKKPEGDKLPFGSFFTDHMLVMDYDEGIGWHDMRIEPYGPVVLDPAAACLHYAQETFEGLKAYHGEDGGVYLFRPDENFRRLNSSDARVCIPELDEELCIEGLKKLVELERDWIPASRDASLYIRPFVFATQAQLGVHASTQYKFIIICSPSGPYYPNGLEPIKIYVENNYVRAVRGGTGYTKTGANYAISLKAQTEAHEQGFSQVLWLDGVEKKYVEEVGAMNIMFVVDGEIITPSLETGSLLSGITRKSCLELLRQNGYKATERRITIQELADAYDAGKLTEVFGTGTAAVISPVGLLRWGDKDMVINNNEIGPVSQWLYDTLTDIQWGRKEGPEGWSIKVC